MDLFTFLWIFFGLSVGLVAIVIILEKRNPSKTIAWLLILVFLPVAGFILYLFFGRIWREKRIYHKKEIMDFRKLPHLSQFQNNDSGTGVNRLTHPAVKRLVEMIANTSGAPLTIRNDVRFFYDGVEFYEDMFAEIEKAKHHIHISFFIIRNDEVGHRLKSVLIKKAKEGCRVRVIFDHLGSVGLGKRFIRELEEAGVEVKAFLPVLLPWISLKVNNRTHRKIVIIDGELAYTGGFNLGEEYIGRRKRLGYWRDTQIKVTGESVYILQFIFLNDWHFVSKQRIVGEAYFPMILLDHLPKKPIQIASSGPDSHCPSILYTYQNMINNAVSQIWITTPYLIPDDSILMGLKTAALSGVDVKLILPQVPDNYFVYHATHSYVEELLELGVKVYLYQKGFIHSKLVVCDEDVVSVGSANMDMRSFHLNFELNAVIYDREIVKQVIEQLQGDLQNSVELKLGPYRKKKWHRQLIEAVARLFSPLM